MLALVVETTRVLVTGQPCPHPRVRQNRPARGVREESPGRWLLACGHVVDARPWRGDCPSCKGTGLDANGCCGDLCEDCDFGEVPVLA